jgi:hypothetical protein
MFPGNSDRTPCYTLVGLRRGPTEAPTPSAGFGAPADGRAWNPSSASGNAFPMRPLRLLPCSSRVSR